ncbi:hypothetical protein AT15_02320 [Kosmotoga arenicorallina S304]|uniref:ABC transporter domain-containing protein n=1 Tax=Kosmotoga arenicorallina S304 TaxID=1453497 RepID=A0A176K3U1_9BACT|nr:ABC transporter ATP-binding protein [Kosmotoga arenicorallina]OAA31682.1 hypothetical protein AT15_02320 [Kosmotoga arenicorallina S304]
MIKFNNVSFLYNPDTPFFMASLKNISLQIEKGSLSLILGANGAGKTTFLLLAAGLFHPTLGKIYLDGIDITESGNNIARKLIGISFQYPEKYFFSENVKDEVCYAAREFGIGSIPERFQEMMEILGLEGEVIGPRSPFSLSGGEARRVAIGSSIIHNPEIVLFDEPTVSLDVDGIVSIREIISRLKAEGKTIVICTHWPEYFLDIASDIIGLKEGELFFHSNVREFLNKPESWYGNLGLIVEEGLREIKEHFRKTGEIIAFDPEGWINV